MAVRKSEAVWQGSLKDGKGSMKLGSGAFEGAFTWASRFEDGKGTNPEELLGAAHAGCYSMALASRLSKAGILPERIHTQATVTLGKVDDKSRITDIHLDCEAVVPGVSLEMFQTLAEDAKINCPVSAALTGVKITLDARLIG
jgi:osmotically inducible protein OsmC